MTAPDSSAELFHVLAALAAVIVAGRALGRILQFAGQPPVIGEVAAGILLGPSLLGRVWPDGFAWLMPASSAPGLSILAQVGIVVYMFVVGLELDLGALRGRGRATLAISAASMIVPFGLGWLIAAPLHGDYAGSGATPAAFGLFLGAALSITAFPVLARILSARGLTHTPLGATALTCAAMNDAAAWCLLALVTGFVNSQVGQALGTCALAVGYLAVMWLAVRPALARFAPRLLAGQPGQGALALVLSAMLLSALVAEWIGIHAIFGAFALGAIIPHGSGLARGLTVRLEDFVCVLLLPAYFALTGLRTELSLIAGADQWLWCAAIIVAATAGKLGGTLAAGRGAGLSWREAASLGTLLNTRGLMELIVLNIGLDLGVISPTLFAMMVVMALVTTLATTPLLTWLWPEAGGARPPRDTALQRTAAENERVENRALRR